MAQRLTTAHLADLRGLQLIAERQNGSLPANLSTGAQTMMQDLQKSGRALDHDYLNDMINAHQDLVSAYQAEIAQGDNADLKAFAMAGLEPTQRHLVELQRLAARR